MAKRDIDKADKRVDFAKRHFRGVIHTFNASSAIWRAQQLKDEIAEFEDRPQDFRRREPMRPLEFTSYYMVALVTCLEWHARARLFSLLSYDPKSLRVEDIKLAASADLLEQLLHERFTIAHLVAASTLVSDLGKYLAIFDRVLNYLDVKTSAVEVLKAGKTDPDTYYIYLADLFRNRHTLVHEIDLTQVGHWNLRNPVSFAEAHSMAEAVVALMTDLERLIWNHAKPDFPDLVWQENGYVSRANRLLSLITEVEHRILLAVSRPECGDIDKDALERSINASRLHLEQEDRMLGSLRYAGDRYYSVSEPLMNRALENRLAYVRELETQLNDCGVIYECKPITPDDTPQSGD